MQIELNVDVVWSTVHRGKQLVSTIVENAEVLSAARSVESGEMNQPDKPIPAQITLMVTIKDAQKLQLAKTSGTLSLNLRGDSDATQSGSETITIDRLLKPIMSGQDQELQGRLTMAGKEYIMRGGKLSVATKDDQ